ncbi:MAG: flagellar basal body-associated FliL family protein [bacterium]|nr:flagellar basal body-associated FliL family protein [bacterium]
MKKLLLIGGGVIAAAGLVAGGVFAGMKMTAKAAPAAAVTTADEVAQDAGGDAKTESDMTSEHGEAKGEGGGEGAKESGTPAKLSRKDLTFTMGKILANLQDPSGHSFYQATIHLEAATPKDRETLEDNEIPLRDAAISLLSGKTPDEVDSPADIERLKRELKARFEGILDPGALKTIYITDNFMARQ